MAGSLPNDELCPEQLKCAAGSAVVDGMKIHPPSQPPARSLTTKFSAVEK